jgi:hypothetical protein
MATPNRSKIITLTITNGAVGEPITIRNRTTGEALHDSIQSATKHVIDLGNFTDGWTDGDILDVVISGERMGAGTVTLSGNNPQTATIATTAITAAIPRGI